MLFICAATCCLCRLLRWSFTACLQLTVLPADPPLCMCRMILETEAAVIASRVAMRGADADLPLSEQVRIQGCFCRTIVYLHDEATPHNLRWRLLRCLKGFHTHKPCCLACSPCAADNLASFGICQGALGSLVAEVRRGPWLLSYVLATAPGRMEAWPALLALKFKFSEKLFGRSPSKHGSASLELPNVSVSLFRYAVQHPDFVCEGTCNAIQDSLVVLFLQASLNLFGDVPCTLHCEGHLPMDAFCVMIGTAYLSTILMCI